MHGEIGALDGPFGKDGSVFLRKHDEALVFEIELFLVPRPVFGLDHLVRFGETAGDVALDDGLVLHGIERIGRGLENRDGLLQGEEGREFVDLDAHAPGGRGGQFGRLGGDDGDGFAAVADFAADVRQQRHRAVVHVHDVFARDVLRGGAHDAGCLERRIGHDGLEDAAGDGGPHDDAMQDALVVDVVQIAGRAANLAVGIHAGHAGADQPDGFGCAFRHRALLRIFRETLKQKRGGCKSGNRPRTKRFIGENASYGVCCFSRGTREEERKP